MSDLLPPPVAIGAPDSFEDWRPDQPAAILRTIDSPARFVGLVMPTGSGKTLTYVSAHLLTGKRTAILTSTKGLQSQIGSEFEEIGLADVRGQNAYECLGLREELSEFASDRSFVSCEHGPCHGGIQCSLREKGCLYYDAVRRARQAQAVVTNYKFWMAQYAFGEGIGKFDILVLDEAHNAPEELASFLSTSLTMRDIEQTAQSVVPQDRGSVAAWRQWASSRSRCLATMIEEWIPRSRQELGLHRQARNVLRKLLVLERMAPDDWIVTEQGSEFHFDPLWASKFAEEVLFLNTPRVILTSATFNSKTAELLGVNGGANLDMYEVPSGFPVARRPVIWVPTAYVDQKRFTADAEATWLTRIDQIIRARQDRKGIVHTISYKRRNTILQRSEFRDQMISHGPENARSAVEKFKLSPPGTILISPSMTTGWDFPAQECEYQIVTKIPFPDSRSPVMQARTQQDRDYPAYIAMQELVQAVGRGMRSADDQCECFLIDDNAQWFMSKYRRLAPQWFLAAYRKSETIPLPPPPLC